MGVLDPCCHRAAVHSPQCFQKLSGGIDRGDHLLPVHRADRVDIFQGDLFIGDRDRLMETVIGQMAQMEQQGQDIIFRCKGGHVIMEGPRIDPYMFACQHLHNSIFQAVHVHLDVDLQRFIGLCLVPVCPEPMAQHSLYHGPGAVHRMTDLAIFRVRDQLIAVIPGFCLIKAHAIVPAEILHFLFRKSKICGKLPGVCHRVFRKHI